MLEFNAVPTEKGVMITMRTPEGSYLGEKLPRPNRGETEMWVRIGCILAEHLSDNETQITFLASADGNIVKNM